MVGFPQVPQIRGDTDDDASIHLRSHIGPAKPIRSRHYDQQIKDILNRKPLSDSEGETDLDNEDLNRKFQKFAQKLTNLVYDSEDDDTQVEEEENLAFLPRKRSRTSSKQTSSVQPLISIYDPKFLGFIIGLLVIVLFWPSLPRNVSDQSVDLSGVNSHITRVEQRVLDINDIAVALTKQLDISQSKQDAFIEVYSENIASLESQLSSVSSAATTNSQKISGIQEEIQTYKEKLDNMELVKEDPQELTARLEDISNRLGQLSKLNADIDSFKDSIVSSLVEKLPDHVPIFFKDRKIHYLPEFQKFLYSFIEKHNSRSDDINLSWDDFLKQNDSSLKEYILSVLKHPSVKFVTREHFEKSLNDFLSRENAVLDSKLNKIIDAADLTGNLTDFETIKKANSVLLENLVETVTKRSIKINYAEYGLGSRILGYLTSTGLDSYKTKSFARKLFLGWYDYLSSNGLRSAKMLKFNANNILVDNGDYWRCEDSSCSVGIRLLSPIILTDMVLKNPLPSRPADLKPPSKVSIFVKPRNKKQVPVLREYLRRFRPEFLGALGSNKYLSKFFKIQEVEFPGGSSIEHIKLPTSIINMKVLVRDLYLQLESDESTPGLCNVKVYGIEEYFSLKYADEFESILDGIHHDETTKPIYYDSSRILGEDDYVYV